MRRPGLGRHRGERGEGQPNTAKGTIPPCASASCELKEPRGRPPTATWGTLLRSPHSLGSPPSSHPRDSPETAGRSPGSCPAPRGRSAASCRRRRHVSARPAPLTHRFLRGHHVAASCRVRRLLQHKEEGLVPSAGRPAAPLPNPAEPRSPEARLQDGRATRKEEPPTMQRISPPVPGVKSREALVNSTPSGLKYACARLWRTVVGGVF